MKPGARPRYAARIDRIRLRDGVTWARCDGPADGPPVLLIHGATVPNWGFDGLAGVLNRAGFRTYRFDLYGHGRSARPDLRYDHELFVRQAEGVLDYYGLSTERNSILGYSMGGAIAATLAGRGAAARLVLTAPMLDFSTMNPFGRVLRTPLLGESFMALIGRPGLMRRRRLGFGAIDRPDLARRFHAQTTRPGFWRAMLRIERDGALGDQRDAYRRAARCGVATLIVSGTDDPIIPTDDIDTIDRLMPAAQRVDLQGLTHNLMVVDPGRVGRHVVEFLQPAESMRGPASEDD